MSEIDVRAPRLHLVDAPKGLPDVDPGFQTPLNEQEWYAIRPRGALYARYVAHPSRWQGRLYPAGSYYICLQGDGRAEYTEILSEFEFRRRYAIVGDAAIEP